MKTKVDGIPCNAELIRVTGKYVHAKTNADPDSCYEAEYPEVEWELQDRNGRRAEWLERKLTTEDRARIESALLAELES